MKTEVILTSNIVGLGGESDQVRVAAGYARNYLLPQGLAIPVNGANKRRLDALRQRRAEREAHEFNSMTELSKGLSKLVCVIKVKTGDDGKLFGAVTNGMIADELKHQFDVTLEKRKIHLDAPIKTLGEHEVELHLHGELKSTLKIRVESTNAMAATAGDAADAKAEAPHTEKRGRRTEAAAAEAPKAEKPAKAEKKSKKAE